MRNVLILATVLFFGLTSLVNAEGRGRSHSSHSQRPTIVRPHFTPQSHYSPRPQSRFVPQHHYTAPRVYVRPYYVPRCSPFYQQGYILGHNLGASLYKPHSGLSFGFSYSH